MKYCTDEANPNVIDRLELDFHYAVSNSDEGNIRLLLAAGANPNTVDRYGWTPLHAAVFRGHEEIIQLLLAAGADPNAGDQQYGWTPLHYTASFGCEEIVQLLLAAGADPRLRTDGETPAQGAGTPKLRALLANAEYVWTHTWNIEEHTQWTEAQRLERVGALSVWKRQNDGSGLPFFPRELQFRVLELMD